MMKYRSSQCFIVAWLWLLVGFSLSNVVVADGRGLRERQVHEEVQTRAAVQKRLILDQRERREEELRELVNRARVECGGIGGGGITATTSTAVTVTLGGHLSVAEFDDEDNNNDNDDNNNNGSYGSSSGRSSSGGGGGGGGAVINDTTEASRQREGTQEVQLLTMTEFLPSVRVRIGGLVVVGHTVVGLAVVGLAVAGD